MPEITPGEVVEALRKPVTIYPPDGVTFACRVIDNDDAKSVKDVFRSDFIIYELLGPGDNRHLWLYTHELELLPDPGHADRPRPRKWCNGHHRVIRSQPYATAVAGS
jgi:hypothetical protein